MSYMHRPQETTYYESNTEMVREPYESYSGEYPHQCHHNGSGGGGGGGVVGQVVGALVDKLIPGSHSHGRQHNQHGEFIERREERFVENSYDPYRRGY